MEQREKEIGGDYEIAWVHNKRFFVTSFSSFTHTLHNSIYVCFMTQKVNERESVM